MLRANQPEGGDRRQGGRQCPEFDSGARFRSGSEPRKGRSYQASAGGFNWDIQRWRRLGRSPSGPERALHDGIASKLTSASWSQVSARRLIGAYVYLNCALRRVPQWIVLAGDRSRRSPRTGTDAPPMPRRARRQAPRPHRRSHCGSELSRQISMSRAMSNTSVAAFHPAHAVVRHPAISPPTQQPGRPASQRVGAVWRAANRAR